ncbi:NUDIX hydrolase [Candidatus Synechococcus calcipolaris G9]|uniref:NUDIX hydrolase n=1 Tax=Candidatus Synechococcus calcipolaris G9 TaxID=1497997 RepID=A0ABT6EXT7_9SYNE|nr:NUDIX hydrolase [Candidatus Synechococcus calcipolaris]MDG2990614.1 NUDIX hydrolase [Candidatus Synechococcus calcipolaris G9]
MGQLLRLGKFLLGFILRHPITAVSVIARQTDGTIVLVQRQDNHQWSLPGGVIDWGETVEAAARRELREETGLEWQKLDRLVGIYSQMNRDPRAHSICIALAIQVTGTVAIADPQEIRDIRAYPPEQIPLGDLAHDHRQQLEDYFSGRLILN